MKNNFLRMALGSAVLWAIVWIGIKSAENNGFTTTILWASIGRGLFMGISWALIMKWMSGDPYKHVKLKLEADETVVKEGGANLIPVNKGEGGKLAITNKRLLFKGQRYDTRDFQMVIEYDKIENIRIHKSWKLLKNELHITMLDATKHRFAVDNPDQWLNAIEGHISSARNMHLENA